MTSGKQWGIRQSSCFATTYYGHPVTYSTHMTKNKHHNHPAANEHPDSKKESTNRHVYIEPGAKIDIVDDLRKQHDTEREEDRSASKKQLFWTRLAAGLVLLYTLVTVAQAYLTRESNDVNRKSVGTYQRAWIQF